MVENRHSRKTGATTFLVPVTASSFHSYEADNGAISSVKTNSEAINNAIIRLTNRRPVGTGGRCESVVFSAQDAVSIQSDG